MLNRRLLTLLSYLSSRLPRTDDDANSKQGDNEEDPEDGPSEARSSSAGVDSKDGKSHVPILIATPETRRSVSSRFVFITTCSINTNLDDEESTAGTATSAAPTPAPSETNPELIWPTMQDLNTRLRRVITSYQRNYKKEELKQQQKAKVSACDHEHIPCFLCTRNHISHRIIPEQNPFV